jgi:hypothetical protein
MGRLVVEILDQCLEDVGAMRSPCARRRRTCQDSQPEARLPSNGNTPRGSTGVACKSEMWASVTMSSLSGSA